MNEEKAIQENSVPSMNAVIAQFDEWERVYPGNAPRNSRGLAQFRCKDGRSWRCFISDGIGKDVYPPFNNDWNYLLPVWKKCIDKMPSVASKWEKFWDWFYNEWRKFRIAVDTNQIDVAHGVLYEFVTIINIHFPVAKT